MPPRKKSTTSRPPKEQSFQEPPGSSTPTTLAQQLASLPLNPDQKCSLGVYITKNLSQKSDIESILPLYESDEEKVRYLLALLEEPGIRFCLTETFVHSFFSDLPFFP